MRTGPGKCLLVAVAMIIWASPVALRAAALPLEISGLIDRPIQVGAEELRAQPATAMTVFFHTGHGPTQARFIGVSLWFLLERAGIKSQGARGAGLRNYVVVQGSDGYYAVVSQGELDPEFGGQQAILAYSQDGKDTNGIRLILPGDKGGGRNVMNVVRIVVRKAEP